MINIFDFIITFNYYMKGLIESKYRQSRFHGNKEDIHCNIYPKNHEGVDCK